MCQNTQGLNIIVMILMTIEIIKIILEEDKDFIDFNDIMTLKKQDNVDKINTILDSLSSMVIATYESVVPIDAIVNKFDNTIEEITSKKRK